MVTYNRRAVKVLFPTAVTLLEQAAAQGGRHQRNLQMSGDPHYQPEDLKPYLGYDQRVGWQILSIWFWMLALAYCGVMPPAHADLLTEDLLRRLLFSITTTKVTELERRKTKHDVKALLELMRAILPAPLHRWLHLACTSYDVISTAYAIQIRVAFYRAFLPKAKELDDLWRVRIGENVEVVQSGRTHLQTALPITVGCWLSVLHSRFVNTVRRSSLLVREIPGKFSGAIGTRAALRALAVTGDPEVQALTLLELPKPQLATQVTQPEGMARFYHELVLVSASLANLGDDVRHLQASEIAEVISASSGSSAMSHKTANPIAAEQLDGMHVSVRCEYDKVMQTLNSTLQRVLRESNVMRGYNAIMVYTYQQMLTAERVLKTLSVDRVRCLKNFDLASKLVVAELLHLSLQLEGLPEAHALVNEKIVPAARDSGNDLATEMDNFTQQPGKKFAAAIWKKIPDRIRQQLKKPQLYLGDAVKIAKAEAGNGL